MHNVLSSTYLSTAYYFTGKIYNARCLVQYWFSSGQEHKVQIKPHGNSKQTYSYCRTSPSTMLMLKEECKDAGPKDTVHNVYEKQGGILSAKNLGELPRNRTQVANVRRKSDVANSLCSKRGTHSSWLLSRVITLYEAMINLLEL